MPKVCVHKIELPAMRNVFVDEIRRRAEKCIKAGYAICAQNLDTKAWYTPTGAGPPRTGCVSHPTTETFSADIQIHIHRDVMCLALIRPD